MDLYGNKLNSLPPGIGKLAALVHLNLKENLLTALPPELGGLRALEYLDLQANQLADLPAAMTALGPLALSIGGNRLCALAPSMESWIRKNEPDYLPADQTCP